MVVRGSEAFQVLKAHLKPTLLILLWMTGLRLLLFVALFYHQIGFHPDLPAALWAGFRFDLLIMGFFWIPIVLLTWAVCLIMPPRYLFFFWKLYFVVGILIIFDFSWMDFFWTAVTNRRLDSHFFNADLKFILDQGWHLVGETKAWIVTLAMGFSSLGLVLAIYGLKLEKNYNLPSKTKLAVEFFLSFFLVASAARGTWTAHHLRGEDALVSTDAILNQLPLNPLWNLDH
ncbi:MAG: hypothetical protein ACAH59_12290 [Pseudobdellovibrionaceae bacterium]